MPTRPYLPALAIAVLATATPRVGTAQADSTRADSTAPARARPRVVKHVVKRGDTLWDIAKFYLKDPFRWPEVFHHNTDVVKDPHWIYPGEVLTIEGDAVRDEVAAQVDSTGFVVQRVETHPPASKGTVFLHQAPAAAQQPAATLQKRTAYTVREGEYDAAPWVVAEKAPLNAGTLVRGIEPPARGLRSDAGYKLYERLYLIAPPGTSPKVGDRLVLAAKGDVIPDVGQVIEPTGIVRVDSAPARGPISATIVRQFDTIRDGQLTLPFDRSYAPTTVRPVAGAYPTSAKLLWVQRSPVLASLQTYAVLGVSAGVKPGDEFTLYDAGPRIDDVEAPPVATATFQVIRVTPRATTVLMVAQTQPKVQSGMTARLTAKMP